MKLRWQKTALLMGDCVIFFAAITLAVAIRRPALFSNAYLLENFGYFLPVLPLWIAAFYVMGLYDFRNFKNIITILRHYLLVFFINIGLSIALFYVLPPNLSALPKTNILLTAVVSHLLFILWRNIWTKLILSKILIRKVAFRGNNAVMKQMTADIIDKKIPGFEITAAPDFQKGTGENKYWHPGDIKNLPASVDIDMLIVDAEELEDNPSMGQAVLSMAVARNIPIYTHLDFYEEIYAKIPPEDAAKPTWLFSNVLHEKNRFETLPKRFMDMTAALAGLLILSPVIIIISFALWFADKASPFYTQMRTGYLGRGFRILKFRTMVPGAEKMGPLYNPGKEDARITPFGAWLRRMRMDEILQLWNVLRGDMSLVGPRPEWAEEVRILEQKVPHYHLRHLVKPGITGWAQINFRATNNEEDSLEKLHYDLYYVKNISLALDLGILLKTIRRVFQHETTFNKTK